jgi:hypothetical protein
MYKTRKNRNEKNCNCPCHCRCYANDGFNNKSVIISNIKTQNPNSNFQSSSFSNFPSLGRNDICNLTYDSDMNNKNLMRNMKLRERAQSLKDKINSKFFIESINNNRGNRWNKSYNNFNNLDNSFSSRILRYPPNKSMSTLSQNRFGNEENQVLKNLLSKIPRHDKSPYSAKSYMEKLKLSFSNGIGSKTYNFKPYLNKDNQGYTSVIMPPNDLETVIIRNNANI